MKPVYIFCHSSVEGPGYLSDFFDQQQIPYRLICADQGAEIPDTLDNCSALVFMGGPMSVNDDLPWIEPELNLIRQAMDKQMPVLGHCLGGQLISKALGGTVETNRVKEFGWHDVEQENNTAATQWFGGLPQRFSAFHWHGETFSLPDGAVRILSNEFCINQGFVIGNTLALQCHIEMTADMVNRWATLHPEDIAKATPSIQTHDQMMENLAVRISTLQTHAFTIYNNWLKNVIE